MTQQESIHPAGASGYDAHHPPSLELIDKCVHCGFCLPVCPTYVLWNEEMDSPRGRIYLMKMVAEGTATINETWVGHFDACLGCMACMPACPSGVDYAKLIEATRAQIERRYTRPASELRFRRFLFSIFTRPARLRALLLPLRLYQKVGLEGLVRRLGIPKLLPARLRSMEALLPQVPAQEPLPELIPAHGERRRRVGLLLGCVQRVLFPHVNAATARVLAAEGCEVVIPAAQPCCGALLVHAGEEEQAVRLARRTIDAFEKAKVDAVVINAAGCGSNVKEYGHLLRDDPQYAGAREGVCGKVPRRHRIPGRARAARHLPSAAPARGLPRCLPLAARAGNPRAAALGAGTDSAASIAGDPRSRDLLRLCGNLQHGATGSRHPAGRSEGGPRPRAGRGHGCVRKPRLPAPAPVCPRARRSKVAGSPQRRTARCIYPRRFPVTPPLVHRLIFILHSSGQTASIPNRERSGLTMVLENGYAERAKASKDRFCVLIRGSAGWCARRA